MFQGISYGLSPNFGVQMFLETSPSIEGIDLRTNTLLIGRGQRISELQILQKHHITTSHYILL